MLKRKYGDRLKWKRVLKRKYAQSYLETPDFTGYISLIHILKVSEPLIVLYGGNKVCIVDDGYMWLQQFPLKKNYSVTTMFNSKGEIVQWYIDICQKNSSENDVPFMDDLFLDIVVLPTGEVIHKDTDELEEAHVSGEIDKDMYKLAKEEAEAITEQINIGAFHILKSSQKHRELLAEKLK